MEIEFLRGDAAHEVLQVPDFISQWNHLYACCPWASGHQSAAFARVWYHVYRDVWEPLLLVGRHQYAMEGLLALAVSGDERLVVCGAHQAEYQCWVTTAENSASFIAAALDSLWRMFPKARLVFRYLPPGVPLNGLRRAICETRRRPLLLLDEKRCAALLRGSNNRRKSNGLARLAGAPLTLLQPQTRQELEPFIDAISAACDTRIGMLHGERPFKDDPHKREFYLTQFDEPKLAHAAVLTAGNQMIAAHIGIRNRESVSLGVITHAETFARYSPGSVLIFQLANQLAGQGYKYFDLTPGDDAYKERFATAHDEAIFARVFASDLPYCRAAVTARLRRICRPFVHAMRRRLRSTRPLHSPHKSLTV
jgi:CelD/BcsL family acetyltransferase involved in cellulose biosynthesis